MCATWAVSGKFSSRRHRDETSAVNLIPRHGWQRSQNSHQLPRHLFTSRASSSDFGLAWKGRCRCRPAGVAGRRAFLNQLDFKNKLLPSLSAMWGNLLACKCGAATWNLCKLGCLSGNEKWKWLLWVWNRVSSIFMLPSFCSRHRVSIRAKRSAAPLNTLFSLSWLFFLFWT